MGRRTPLMRRRDDPRRLDTEWPTPPDHHPPSWFVLCGAHLAAEGGDHPVCQAVPASAHPDTQDSRKAWEPMGKVRFTYRGFAITQVDTPDVIRAYHATSRDRMKKASYLVDCPRLFGERLA